MQIDATGDDYGDPDLFSISVIKVSCCISISRISLESYSNISLEDIT